MHRILIVDDSPPNIKILNDFLRDTYRISVATNGPDALALVKKEPPDMILLDIMMPEMDGYDVCRFLKASEDTAGIPIIFVTAKTEIEDEQKGLELGAVDYIIKPISPPITLARIRNHLELKQARDHLEELVAERTILLQRKVKELEARDRLIRFQMQSPDVKSAGWEILKEISEVVGTDCLCLFFPVSSEGSLEPVVAYERSRITTGRAATLQTESAQKLVADTFREKRIKSTDANLIASPIVFQDEVLGVISIVISESAAELKEEIAGTLWRMASEAAMVLRMAHFTEDIQKGSVDFDSLLDMAEKNL